MFQRDHGDRTAGRVVDDNRITDQVRNNLENEPVYKFNDVAVKTFDGVVQLSGFVNSQDQKQRAGQVAQNTPGVSRVVNAISLKPQAPTPTGMQGGYPNNMQTNQSQTYPEQNPNTAPR